MRLALGAAPRQIFTLVVAETLKLAAVGLLIGMAGAFAVSKALGEMLFGIPRTDVVTFAGTRNAASCRCVRGDLPAGAAGDPDRPDGGAGPGGNGKCGDWEIWYLTSRFPRLN